METFSAIVLWAGSTMRKIASFILCAIMANACVTHFWLNQEFGFPMTLMACSALVFVLSFDTPPAVAVVSKPRSKKE
jgi:hypothetical protein